ncbi:MAG: hypothetical protein WDO74_14370 [Pseudomonadota bacterium]
MAIRNVRFPMLLVLLGSAACSSTDKSSPGAGGSSNAAGSPSTTAGTSSGGASGSGAAGGATAGTGGTPGGVAGNATSAAGSAGVAPGTGGASGAAGGAAAGSGGGSADVCPTLPTAAIAADKVVQYNDNGGWCWYQDERVVVDTKASKFIIGSVASGGSRDGQVEVVISDLTGANQKKSTLGKLDPDDHNAPAFVIRPDGKYAAMWAGHRQDCNSYYSVFDGTAWAAQKKFDWAPKGCPWDSAMSQKITYSNMWYLSAESKLFSAVRSVQTSPNFLTSSDNGDSFAYYGRMTATPTTGYVAGYYKYWGNGTDRIDFLGTEAHPRDADTSLWHGYYKGGKTYDSSDKVIDDNTGDANAQNIDKYTKVFGTGTTIGGVKLEHMWNHDMVRYADGTIAITGQGRVNGTGSDDPDKRMIYARFDGTSWKTTYLVKAGKKLYPDEQDYTGLSALHPDNPHIIFVSTTTDPRDDKTTFPKHEIFEGVTCDNGATFTWAPITQNSTVDNLRPVVPKWDSSHTLLLWLTGTYNTAQKYTLKVVGSTALGAAP